MASADLGIIGLPSGWAVLGARRIGAMGLQHVETPPHLQAPSPSNEEELARLLHGQVRQLEQMVAPTHQGVRSPRRRVLVTQDGSGWVIQVWAQR